MGVLPQVKNLFCQISCLQEKPRDTIHLVAINAGKSCEKHTWNSNLCRFCYMAVSSEPLLMPFRKPLPQTSFGASTSFTYASVAKLGWLLALWIPWKILHIDITSLSCAQLSFLSSQKHVFKTGRSGSLSHSPLSFFFFFLCCCCAFSLHIGVLNFVWVEKKKTFVFSICFACFGKLCCGGVLHARSWVAAP